jgi:hypothetical protein
MKLWAQKKPDLPMLLQKRDIDGLIKALQYPDFNIQWQAADALGKSGKEGIDRLLGVLTHKNREVQLGVIEALGEIKDPRSAPSLIELLKNKSVEVRWATAIALGEIGDVRAIGPLVVTLGDTDKYVRYGAAITLEKMGWQPRNDSEKAYLFLGKQDWDQLGQMGEAAIKPLSRALKDSHVDVRTKVMEVVGQIGCEKGIGLIIRGLRDENPAVRWRAALSGPKCGIPHMYLPRGLNKRPRIRKNPRIAAFLNFVLPGQGYNYLGIWWGTLVFQLDVTITLYMLNYELIPGVSPDQFTYTVMLPLYVLFALHGWYIARKMPEL